MARARRPRAVHVQSLNPPIVSDVGTHRVQQLESLRVVIIDESFLIRLTPLEYRIFQFLVTHPDRLISTQELVEGVVEQIQPTRNEQIQAIHLERHIKALRLKLRYSGLSICRVVAAGWLLTGQSLPDEPDVL